MATTAPTPTNSSNTPTSTSSNTLLDLNAFNSLNQTQFTSLIGILFDYMINIPTNTISESQKNFQNFILNENLKKGYEILFYNLIEFLLNSIRHHRSSDYIYNTIINNSLQDEYAIILKGAYGRHLSVITTLFDENIFKLSKLLDLEWRFGVTTANSSLNTQAANEIQSS